jgi:hypothetical protein
MGGGELVPMAVADEPILLSPPYADPPADLAPKDEQEELVEDRPVDPYSRRSTPWTHGTILIR